MKVGVVGAGAISDIYLQNMIHTFDNLEVVSICANHLENAQKKAEQYGIRACTREEMMEDEAVEMIVNLTPANVHYEIIKDALEHGKHVYTEKVMTDDPATAAELVALAEEKGLYLGSAPDTFMGSAIQVAKDIIDSGKIGKIHSFSIAVNRDNRILDSIFAFHRLPGSGAAYDYGVYHMTALCSLLGPVREVAAFVDCPYPKKVGIIPGMADFGKEFDTPNESQIAAILKLESGIHGTLHMNCDSLMADQAFFAIYGTEGILYLTDPNQFGGKVKLLTGPVDPRNPVSPKEVISYHGYAENSRGLGPSEMAEAIAEGRKNRASKEMAKHVLDVLAAILESGKHGTFEKVTSTFTKPEALPRKKAPIVNLGHTSFQMKHNEEMLHFYGEVLGMKEAFTLTFGDLAASHVTKEEDLTENPKEQMSKLSPEQLETYRRIMECPEKKWLTYFKLADGQFIEFFYDQSEGAFETIEDRRKYYGYDKVNFEVEDINDIRERLLACGVKLEKDVHPTLDGSLEIVVYDPDGNEVQFTQYGAAGQALITMEHLDHKVCSRVSYTTQTAFSVQDDVNMLSFYTKGLGLKHVASLPCSALAKMLESSGQADAKAIMGLKMMGDKPWIDYIEVAPHQYIELFYNLGGSLEEKRNLQRCYGYQHICLEVSDIHEAWDAVTSNGIVPDTEISLGSDGSWQFWVKDPDGNRMEFMEYTPEALQRKEC